MNNNMLNIQKVQNEGGSGPFRYLAKKGPLPLQTGLFWSPPREDQYTMVSSWIDVISMIYTSIASIICLIIDICKKLMDFSKQIDKFVKLLSGSIDGIIKEIHDFYKMIDKFNNLLD